MSLEEILDWVLLVRGVAQELVLQGAAETYPTNKSFRFNAACERGKHPNPNKVARRTLSLMSPPSGGWTQMLSSSHFARSRLGALSLLIELLRVAQLRLREEVLTELLRAALLAEAVSVFLCLAEVALPLVVLDGVVD